MSIAQIQSIAEYIEAGTTTSVTHETRDGGNRYMLLQIHYRNIGTITAPTYNGVSLSLVTGSAQATGSGASRRGVVAYDMVAPPVGAYTLAFANTSDDQATFRVINMVDVDQTTPLRDQSGSDAVGATATGANSSLTPASTTDDLVIDGISVASAPTIGGSQTLIGNTSANPSRERASSRDGTTTTTTMEWTFASDEFGHYAVAVVGSATTQPTVADYAGSRGKKSWVVQSQLGGEALGTGTTTYVSISPSIEASGTETANRTRARVAGVYSNPVVHVTVNAASSNSTWTLLENGSPTSVVITVGAGVIGPVTGSGTLTVDGTSQLSWSQVIGATGGITCTMIELTFEPDGSDTQTILGVHAASSYSRTPGGTSFMNPQGTRSVDATEILAEHRIPIDATWRGMEVIKVGTTSTATVDFISRVNNGDGTQALQWTSGESTSKEDTTHTDAIVDGDSIAFEVTAGAGTGSWEMERVTTRLLNSDGEFMMVAGAGAGSGFNITTGTVFCSVGGELRVTSTEAEAQCAAPFDMVGKRLFVQVGENTSPRMLIARIRINGAYGNMFAYCQAGLGNTYYADIWETDDIDEGDLVCIEIEHPGTTNTFRLQQVGFVGIERASGFIAFPHQRGLSGGMSRLAGGMQ